jgi:hypothetical protein
LPYLILGKGRRRNQNHWELAANSSALIYRQLYAHGIRISNIDFEIEKEVKKSD